MVRKGRFNLLSYIIENSLIFYKSRNRNHNFVAFSIFKTRNLTEIIEVLNDFLKRKFIYYYSIQINLCQNEEFILVLCFRDLKKSNIIKFYNFVKEKITETNKALRFLYEKELENNFLNIFEGIKKNHVKISKKNDHIVLNDEKTIKILKFYELDFTRKEEKEIIFHFLVNLFKDFNKKGFIIFNFKSNDIYEITLSAFYVDILKLEDYKDSNFECEVNKFFDYRIVRKHISSIKDIANLVWRFRISEDQIISNNFLEMFSIEEKHGVKDLVKFNHQFEQILNQNDIKFKRLSLNLLFIEQKVIFLTLLTLDSRLILNLSEKFYSKYKIYILFLDEKEYQKIEKIEKIKDLENLKIFNYRNYPELEIFNKKFFLEDT